MTLAQLKKGQTGIVKTINCKNELKLRLLDMGIVPETKVKITRIAPMGDPLEIRLRGFKLILRADDAKKISIKFSEARI